jgi:hypothetical protein
VASSTARASCTRLGLGVVPGAARLAGGGDLDRFGGGHSQRRWPVPVVGRLETADRRRVEAPAGLALEVANRQDEMVPGNQGAVAVRGPEAGGEPVNVGPNPAVFPGTGET